MTDRHDLIAYLATLGTLGFVFLTALITSSINPEIIGKIEAFGLGAITGGLIGILRLPRAQSGPTVGPNENVNLEQPK